MVTRSEGVGTSLWGRKPVSGKGRCRGGGGGRRGGGRSRKGWGRRTPGCVELLPVWEKVPPRWEGGCRGGGGRCGQLGRELAAYAVERSRPLPGMEGSSDGI
ncbi:hypothetical protein SORBI_3009G018100 [Sorghum bicolor]|uniref:Uncharacterized protein n=1 Tax=Sorghum bicolor TaxID=4558 RepID=A0A1B6P6A3_SORBI|nr:hypothetical protein SORBI_3009G018100 [Sorghum bicolor]